MTGGSADQRERGRRLREARNRAGLTQEELADRAGLPRTNLPGWERGTRGIGQETAKRLAEQLPDLETADLIEVLSPSFLAALHEMAVRLEEIEGLLQTRSERKPVPAERPPAVIPVDDSAAPSPTIAQHLPYPPHLHRLLEAAAKLTDPSDIHILIEHATYACLDLASDKDDALKAVRGAVSAGARNHRNFNRLIDQTVF